MAESEDKGETGDTSVNTAEDNTLDDAEMLEEDESTAEVKDEVKKEPETPSPARQTRGAATPAKNGTGPANRGRRGRK